MIYSALSPSQQAQAARTFRDSHFGGDPSAYEYEVNARGQVTGRVPLARGERGVSRPRRIPVVLASVEIEPTAEQRQAWRDAIKTLGRLAAEQLMEVQHG